MISYYHFCNLPDEEQSDFVLTNGHFLCSIDRAEYKIGLYHLFDFFVEVFFYKLDNSIVRIRPFRSMVYLDPYLKEVDISELKAV
ncbi:MAG: hypothetical protein ACNS62_05800 [Candidatus Cyclobacteriaceae bacterium M3_2C_046]